MKKFLAIFLALMMILSVSLVACSEKKKPVDDDENWEGEDTYNPLGTGTADTTKDPDDSTPVVSGGTWTDKNDTVYICHPTYLRYSDSNGDKSSIEMKVGDALTRISTNEKWDKVTYNDQTYYVYSYLTTTQKGEVTFTPITPGVTTSIINKNPVGTEPTKTNLRTTPCYDEDLDNLGASALTKAMTSNGELVITGINETKTWVRVTFIGKDARNMDINGTFYCRPSYLEYYQESTTPDSPNVQPV